MQSEGLCKRITARALVFVLSVALVFTMMPLGNRSIAYAEGDGLTVQTPVLVATGTDLVGDYQSAAGVSKEKSWTLDELKGLEGVRGEMYSAKQNAPYTKTYSIVDGVKVSSLIGDLSQYENVAFIASDNRAVTFNREAEYEDGAIENVVGLASGRYFYDGFTDTPTKEVPAVISWAYDQTGTGPEPPASKPTAAGKDKDFLRLFCGQFADPGLGAEDRNGPLFNGKSGKSMQSVVVGDSIDEVVLTVGSQQLTRADVLMMPFAERDYNYLGKNDVPTTETVRGVPISVLLEGVDENSVVSFETADNYPVAASGKTVKELVDGNYMLGYEVGGAGVYDTAKAGPQAGYGYLRLYGDGDDENGYKPSKMVNKVTVTSGSGVDFSTSPYKHITNGGQEGSSPYNIDAITGATLTVEGPGVKTSVPVSVRDLEGRDAGAVRATYTDKREGSDISRTYEGIDLHYILTKMKGSNGIELTDRAKKVMIKNRNRRTIAEFSVDQIEEAHGTDTPIIVAYGTSMPDGTNVRPFVFDNAAGADSNLGNEDGCIKLVYDKNSITGDTNANYKTFGNMAYIYVAEEETPGYKHDKDPYQSPDISNYVVTVTGDKIGREVNYTVQQLEQMVGYGDDGKPDNNDMGYRDEYSLANSTYWYVNEYEGVQLWKLLLKSGLDPSLANDDQTLVSSTATDGYPSTDKFTIKQVADPDSFGFYEKNPADPNTAGWSDENNEVMRDADHPKGDLIARGYPVLIAYGVNGYPYVEKSSQEGYLSGLQNDGGPVRVISGKLRYNHPNGSNQAKYLDKIIVGDNTNHYSTHKYHSEAVYKALADNDIEVKILNGADAEAPVLKEKTYKLGDLEELIYGGSLSTAKLKEAKIKNYYQLTKGSTSYSDLYEGIDLNFFLKEVVELPGYKGTITFSNGTNDLTLSLEDVLATKNGSNTETGMNGLAPILAYGKNGAPMVLDKNAEGYQNKITLAEGTGYQNQISVKNDGGPLAVLFPHTDSSVSDQSLTNVTSITINLSADKYAHTRAPYDAYADYAVTIKGEGTRLGVEGKDFALSELEGKQTIAFTGDYSILKSEGQTPSQTRYRGINLYSLLTSSAVGLKSNADKVIVTTSDNESKEFTLSEIRKADYINSVTGANDLPVILAYGVGKAGDADKEDGVPLVAEKTSGGYDDVYKNNGGPVRFVIGQTDAEDVNSGKNLKFVKSIEITASEMTSWNHNSGEVYKQYRDENVELVINDKDGSNLFDKTFTVGEIEDNTSLVERITATVVQEFTWEGIHLWKWVKQEAGDAADLSNPISVTVEAEDGYNQEIGTKFGIDGLENGIKDGNNVIPIIMAYGVGGYPLVIGDKNHQQYGEGYDSTAQNNGGPLRVVTHNSQGTSVTYLTKITVVVGDGGTQPEEPADFTIKGLESGDIKMSVDDIKNLKNKAGDNVGQAEGEYVRKGVAKTVKGALLKNVLAAKGVENENAVITLNTPDAFETTERGASYNNITLKQAVEQNYFLAYQEKVGDEWVDIDDTVKNTDIHTNLRMYRNYCAANGLSNQNEWYDECTNITAVTLDVPEAVKFKEYGTSGGVRSTWMDGEGTIWVGTYGGGLYSKKAGESEFSVMNTSSVPVALQTDFTSAVAADADGGIWVSQNASYTNPGDNQGVLYIKGSEVTQYTVESNPGTIPNNYVQAIKVDTDGKVWMGSFGGLTIYDPAAETWTTYSKEDKGFPATSINTITLDGKGGAWLGFYPDGSGTEADPYAGGFCHIDKDGAVSEKNALGGTGDPMFAQSWVRNIAIDKKGTVWVVAAGTNIEDNVGGKIFKLREGTGEPTVYTGKDVLGDYLDGSAITEVRVVSVDKDGSLWFGTSADGILKVDNPKLTDGKMTVSAQYAKETGSWSAANMNNVFSIEFWNDGTAYVGTAGGLVVLGDEPAGEQGVEPAGDATEDSAELTITGDALARDGYFSIRGIKNTEGINRVSANFSWQNSSGSTGTAAVEGATLENIFSYIGLAEGAEIDSVDLVSDDNEVKTYTAEEALNAALDGNKAMFIWKEEGTPVQKVIRGQFKEGEANKGKWAKGVVKIVVHKKVEDSSVQQTEALIDVLPDAADISVDDADAILAARDAYEALSEAEKAEVTNYDKLAEALAALDNAVKEGYIEKGETLIDDIDFTDYSAVDSTGLWFNLTRLESKLAKAESAEEAAEIYHQIEEAIANTKTVQQQTLEDLNEFPVVVSVTGRTYNTVTLGWKNLTSARAYTVYRADTPNGEFKELKQIQEAQYTDTNLKTGKTYYYAVVPGAKVKGEYVYGNPSEAVGATPVLSKPAVTLKAGFKKVTVSSKAVAGAEGYVIYRSAKKTSGFKEVKTVAKSGALSFANKSLTMKKTYYYKVKAYRTVDGKKVYSSYSSVKKATTRSLAKPTVTLSGGSQKITVKAKKVTGASGYVVYRSTKKTSGFKAIKTVKKSGSLKFVNSKLKAKKTYYYKVKAFVTEDGKRIYSKYSTVKGATTRR